VLSGDAHTFLRVGGAGVGAGSRVQENVLELVHPGVGEQQSGIVLRHETRAVYDGVSALREVIQEQLADFGTGQFLGHGMSSELWEHCKGKRDGVNRLGAMPTRWD